MIFRGTSRAFTLIELLAAVVTVAVVAALLVPVTNRMLAQAHATKCANNLRVLGSATMLHAADNDMRLPVTSHQRRTGEKSWTLTLQEYASGTVAFRCPGDGNSRRAYSYVINDFLTPNPAGAPYLNFSRLSNLGSPAETFLFGEAAESYSNSDHFHFTSYASEETTERTGGYSIPPEIFERQVAVERHSGKANYVFADGHMESLSWDHVQKLLAADGSRFVDPTAESQSN